jgi:hypothetical protein
MLVHGLGIRQRLEIRRDTLGVCNVQDGFDERSGEPLTLVLWVCANQPKI